MQTKTKTNSLSLSVCLCVCVSLSLSLTHTHLLRPRRPPRRVRRWGLSSNPGDDGVDRDMGLRLSGYRCRRRSSAPASPPGAGESARPLLPPPPPLEVCSAGRVEAEAVWTGTLKASLARRI